MNWETLILIIVALGGLELVKCKSNAKMAVA